MAVAALQQSPRPVGIGRAAQQQVPVLAADHRVVLAGFWSPWCFMAGLWWPRLESLASGWPEGLRCVSVGLGEGEQPLAQFRIRWLPALLLLVDGVPRYRWYGGDLRWDSVEGRVSQALGGEA